MTELERCIEFVCGIGDRAAKEKVPSAYGVAHLHDQFPNVWSRNYLLGTENLETASAEDLAAEAERILGPLGARHRKIELMDNVAGTRLEPEFKALGWLAQCDIVMVAHHPHGDSDTSGAEQVGFKDLVPTWQEGWRADPNAMDEDVVRQLIENRHVVMEAMHTRFFAARADGELASYCELYSDGKTAQIENVFTLERFRKRGLSRAAVSLALETARIEGHDLIFLLADRDDWPQRFYERLGFETIGQIWEFIRSPRGSIGSTTEEET